MMPADYLSYLLRLWRTGEGRCTTWRASLESPMTGSRQSFASLAALFAHLDGLTSAAADASARNGDPDPLAAPEDQSER
jgi:hypothetical protein